MQNTSYNTRLTALCPGLVRWASTRKVKSIWILLKQETVSGSGISWAICKSTPRPRQITMPVPPPLSFLTGRMLFLSPNQQRRSTEGTSKTLAKSPETFGIAEAEFIKGRCTSCHLNNSIYALRSLQAHRHFKVGTSGKCPVGMFSNSSCESLCPNLISIQVVFRSNTEAHIHDDKLTTTPNKCSRHKCRHLHTVNRRTSLISGHQTLNQTMTRVAGATTHPTTDHPHSSVMVLN